MSFFKKDEVKTVCGGNAYENLKEIKKWKEILRNNSFVQEVLNSITADTLKETGITKIRMKEIEGRIANCRYADYGLKD